MNQTLERFRELWLGVTCQAYRGGRAKPDAFVVGATFQALNRSLDIFSQDEFADLLQTYDVDILVYGHIHTGSYLQGDVNGIDYRPVSADHVDMKRVVIAP